MRYYFHVKDGHIITDPEGVELATLDDLKKEAIQSSADLLKAMPNDPFWAGEPWLMWVTDKPNGAGNIVLSLTVVSQLTV